MAVCAGAALHRQALGLVDDDHPGVAIEHALLQQSRIRSVGDGARRLRLRRRRDWQRRHADALPGSDAIAGVDALAVESNLAGAQQLLEPAMAQLGEMPLEPAV